uniref:Protein kinase domain-containing protein n=1 Tax=Chlamydomonas euryale TaxID=1486919 RepID=A0A7R9Z8R5_9CHLO|mmetsp:Transcript_9249/g.28142  ORF Transcript_9249/g.28142 Transcript_9249/m.28142 type:complete len:1514 (+) Transcript_9249:339-4880(+)
MAASLARASTTRREEVRGRAFGRSSRQRQSPPRPRQLALLLVLVLILSLTAPAPAPAAAQGNGPGLLPKAMCRVLQRDSVAECFVRAGIEVNLTELPNAGDQVDLPTNWSIIGEGPKSVVQLPLRSRHFTVPRAWDLRLTNLTLSGVAFLDASRLLLDTVDVKSQLELALELTDVVLQVPDCAQYTELQSLVCDGGRLPGNAIVASDGTLLVQSARSGPTLWQNVSAAPPAGCKTPDVRSVCESFVLPRGSSVTQRLAARQSQLVEASMGAPMRLAVLLERDSTYRIADDADEDPMDVLVNLTIRSLPEGARPSPLGNDAPAVVDMRLREGILRESLGGTLTMVDVAIANAPTRPLSYPIGLLTMLGWYMSVDRPLALPTVSLRGVTLLVPKQEVRYVAALFSGPRDLPGWMALPTAQGGLGLESVPPPGNRTLRGGIELPDLVWRTGEAGVGRSAWAGVSVEHGDTGFEWRASLEDSLASAVRPAGMPLGDFPLPAIRAVSHQASVELAALGKRVGGGGARSGGDDGDDRKDGDGGGGDDGKDGGGGRRLRQGGAPALSIQDLYDFGLMHGILTTSITINESTPGHIQIADGSVLAGNPVWETGSAQAVAAPADRWTYLDFNGITTDARNGRGLIDMSAVQETPMLTIANLQLKGLAPSVNYDLKHAPTEIGLDLANYTSMLWIFHYKRAPGSPSAVALVNCMLLVSPLELQVYRLILQGVTDNAYLGINPDALGLILNELAKPGMQGWQVLSEDVPLPALYEAQGGVGPAPGIPGNVFFPSFSWFGLVGTNVTMAAHAPTELGGARPGRPADIVLQAPLPMPGDMLPPRPPPARAPPPPNVSRGSAPGPPPGTQLGQQRGPPPSQEPGAQPGQRPSLNSSDDDDGGSGLPDWLVAVIVVVCAVSTAVLTGAVWLFVAHRRQTAKTRVEAYAKDAGIEGGGAPRPLLPSSSGSTRDGASDAANLTATCWADAPGGSKPARGPAADASAETSARGDTSALLREIFGADDGNTTGTFISVSSAVPARSAPDDDPRHQIHKRMQVMQQEMSGGESAWEVTGTLGKGGFGVVYKGVWRGLDVAIKRIIFQMMEGGDESERQMALREAAINSTLNHTNIVATYTYDVQPLAKNAASAGGLTDWQMYIIQERCDSSLFAAIQNRRFFDPSSGRPRPSAILSVAADIAAGCSYIHSKSIIHGDLKPDNVLLKACSNTASGNLTPGFVAKVGDFGMSMNMRGNVSHISGVRHGTPLYIAPEILKDGKASPAADVYSFGVILWELVHGKSAWQHLVGLQGAGPKPRRLVTIEAEQFDYKPADLELVPERYAQLARACLSADPSERPTFAVLHTELSGMARAARAADACAPLPLVVAALPVAGPPAGGGGGGAGLHEGVASSAPLTVQADSADGGGGRAAASRSAPVAVWQPTTPSSPRPPAPHAAAGSGGSGKAGGPLAWEAEQQVSAPTGIGSGTEASSSDRDILENTRGQQKPAPAAAAVALGAMNAASAAADTDASTN